MFTMSIQVLNIFHFRFNVNVSGELCAMASPDRLALGCLLLAVELSRRVSSSWNLMEVVGKDKSEFQQKLNNALGGGFKYFLFSPLPGEMIQFDQNFSKWVETSRSGAKFLLVCCSCFSISFVWKPCRHTVVLYMKGLF